MATLAAIDQDKTLLAQFEAERDAIYQTIKQRGAIFMEKQKLAVLKHYLIKQVSSYPFHLAILLLFAINYMTI